MRCACGRLMGTHTIRSKKNKKSYHYYVCRVRHDYNRGSCDQKHVGAEKAEAAVWSFVSGLLKDPERLSAGWDALISEELSDGRDPGREARVLHERVDECARLRAAYQDQQAAGLMTLDELAAKIKELEEAKALAQAELESLSARQQRADDLARDRAALLKFCSESVPQALEDLSPEGKNHVYGLVKLEVVPTDKGFRASGVFCTSELSCW